MPPVGAHGDYGLGDNSDLPPGGAAGGGIDDEDLYGEYGDAYGGGYGDPYGSPLGDLDWSAQPSPSTSDTAPPMHKKVISLIMKKLITNRPLPKKAPLA